MEECPRCHRNCLDDDEAMNSISHIGYDVKICSKCGQAEVEVAMMFYVDIVEIEMEKRFKKEFKF